MAEVELICTSTGLAIREFLREVGEGSPSDFLKAFRKVKKKTSYGSARRYFWICKQLGLIEPTRRVMGRGTIPKQLYRIVAGMHADPRWSAPQIALYPDTAIGRARYRKGR